MEMVTTIMEYSWSVINCQSLDDITNEIKRFELVETEDTTAKIEMNNGDKLELVIARAIQKKPKYRVKISSQNFQWGKMMEEK